jgi:hypothetical protein
MLGVLLSMLLPLIAVIATAAAFWKLAATILRYGGVTWPLAFLVAATIVSVSALVQTLVAVAGLGLSSWLVRGVLPVLLVVLGAWCFHDRALRPDGVEVGWRGALKLSALAHVLFVLVFVALLLSLLYFTGGLRGTLS